jgi:hypothetical protein
MTNQLTIANTAIRQDAEGRYCLNDLHKAAGGERRHEILNWKNTDSFKELVAELAITGIPVVSKPGRNGGTFVVKELVYAYAMWISPAFHLKVRSKAKPESRLWSLTMAARHRERPPTTGWLLNSNPPHLVV